MPFIWGNTPEGKAWWKENLSHCHICGKESNGTFRTVGTTGYPLCGSKVCTDALEAVLFSVYGVRFQHEHFRRGDL